MGANFIVPEEKKNKVRDLLKEYGIRESARLAGVSYYTAWCVHHGKYDQKQLQYVEDNVCPITGFKNL